jgi:hypothetical protein
MAALLNTIAVQQAQLVEYEEEYEAMTDKTDQVLLQAQAVVHNIRTNAGE